MAPTAAGLTPLFPRTYQPLWAVHLDLTRPSFLAVTGDRQAATPKQMALKLVRLLRSQRPDYPYF